MSRIAIKVENLSKAYQIGEFSTGTISQDIERWWVTNVMKKEDPFLKLGETNDRSKKGFSNIVWSLKDINFEINQGDALGIIGKNGAGKSTLLKLLSRVTSPSFGSIKVKGRIASLLEVGTGFHPELTGRENIFLNGGILGMRNHEIKKKLDEIIDFSGVERYIDTPVKRYSSGMYVRLAFAVAAHLESEILIVDEVLAVGDSEFQKKCLGKMDSVSKGEGRTVLFVSHNLASISALCNRILVLNNGAVNFIGNLQEGINVYSNLFTSSLPKINEMNLGDCKRFGNGRVRFKSFNITNVKGHSIFQTGDNLFLEIFLEAFDDIKDFTVTAVICDKLGLRILEMNNRIKGILLEVSCGDLLSIKFNVSNLLLAPGEYLFSLWAGLPNEDMDGIEDFSIIEIFKNNNLITPEYTFQGIYQAQFDFEKIQLNKAF
jgi:lipopolysaccharide transport system ATP-binding protein